MSIAPWMLCLVCLADPNPKDVLATVNGQTISRGAVELERILRGIREPVTPELEAAIVAQLIDRHLVREVLQKRGMKPQDDELALKLAQTRTLISARGKPVETVLKELQLSDEQLAEVVRFPLMWRNYLATAITEKEIDEYYSSHRAELDGTRVRVRQIFLKVADKADAVEVTQIREKLDTVKQEIEAGKHIFAEAAMKFSEAPTKSQGGDVGWIGVQGQLPGAVSKVAVGLAVNELAGPIRSPFGWHLIQVIERKPGQLTAEDARPKVIEALAQMRMQELIARQKPQSRIVLP